MATSSSDSRAAPPAEATHRPVAPAPPAPAADATLQTFVVDVSAGRPLLGGDAGMVRVDPPTPRRAPPPLAESDEPAALDLPAPDDRWPPAAGPTALANAKRARRGRRRTASRRAARRARPLAAWPASAVVHAAALAMIGWITVAERPRLDQLDVVLADPTDMLDFDPPAEPPLEAPSEVAELVDDAPGGAELPGELPATGDGGAAPRGPESEFASVAGLVGEATAGLGVGTFGEPGAMFGSGGGAGHGRGTGLGAAPLAKFFGAAIKGRRIVFVLDNSGSMQDGRLETVVDELKRCVDSLADDQRFYVIFYSDAAYPLFYPEPARDYLRPTPQNKERLAAWLDTVELCLGDSVVAALTAAASIEPDAVYLLSDGRIQGAKKMAFLLAAESRNFPIHAFGVGLGRAATASRRNLQDVAAANGGEFREADVPAALRDAARRQPRPYHHEAPGPVWGRNVRPGGWGK